MTLLVPFEQYSWPIREGYTPFDHQKEIVRFWVLNPRGYNLSGLGTGKTLASLWAVDFLMLNKKIKRVLIVGPLSTLQSVWGREIFTNFPHRKYKIAHGSKSFRQAAISSDVEFVIINHDGVVPMEEDLVRAKFDIVIIDELTAFKNATSNRGKAMARIAKSVRGVHGLTGAPTPNGPTEAFGQAKVVNPENPCLPRYFTAFRNMVEYQAGPYLWLEKPEAANVVHSILQPAIKFDRDDCIDIPPCQYDDIAVPLTDQQQAAYNEMKRDFSTEYEEGLITASNAAVKAMKLLQISAGSVKDDSGGAFKLDSSTRDEELWRVFEETGKTKLVVFCAFRASIDHLVEWLRKKGAKTECIHGDVAHANRAKHILNFQEGGTQILVIQPQSSAHGITLTASCTIVWYSLIASGEIYIQANGRITRAGQKRKQLILHFMGSEVERRILKILQGKGDFSQGVLSLFSDL
jgi:SNF2 family DNA or RNA helicase